jgi:hypothetical protein
VADLSTAGLRFVHTSYFAEPDPVGAATSPVGSGAFRLFAQARVGVLEPTPAALAQALLALHQGGAPLDSAQLLSHLTFLVQSHSQLAGQWEALSKGFRVMVEEGSPAGGSVAAVKEGGGRRVFLPLPEGLVGLRQDMAAASMNFVHPLVSSTACSTRPAGLP